MRIFEQAPYYDDYRPDKNYTQLLARPGFVAQAREFNQCQTTQRDFLSRLGDAIYKDGSVISGLDIVVSDTKKSVQVSPGRLYLDGLVRVIRDPQVIAISGIGQEVIGVKLDTKIVTEVEDPTLRDPAQSSENYNREGAHRVQEEVKWVLNDSDSVPVFNLFDGNLAKKVEEAGTPDWFMDILAQRTYDESGNYKIRGLQIYDKGEVRDTGTESKLILGLTEGKAYIVGREVVKPTVSDISISRSLDKRSVKGESKTYSTSKPTYKLNNQPFSEFNRIQASVKYTEKLTRGQVRGGRDYLTKAPVVSITKISQASTSTTYKQGVDFQITDDSIDWGLAGDEPNVGTEYTVEYVYTKQMEIGTDLEVDIGSDNVASLKFLEGGDTPVENTPFYVDYNYFLARVDLIALDKEGMIHVIEGQSDVLRNVQSPKNQDTSLLELGTVLIYPQSDNLDVVNYNTYRLTQGEIYNLLRRIQDLEYNMAITDLDEEAISGESASNLKGILTDGFIGFTKCDLGSEEFDASIDFERGFMTVPFDQSVHPLIVNESLSRFSSFGKSGRVITSQYTEVPTISQDKATSDMNVNPYSAYDLMSLIELNPAVDTWIDTERVRVDKTQTKTNVVRNTRTLSKTEESRESGLSVARRLGGRWTDWNGKVITEGTTTSSSTNSSWYDGGSSSSMTSQVVLDEIQTYMRSRSVEVTGYNFSGGDAVKLLFNGQKIPLRPSTGYSAGSDSGTVLVKSDGTVKGTFTVPEKQPSGAADVQLIGKVSTADTTYRAQGRTRIVQDTIITTRYRTQIVTTTITNTRKVTRVYDPLAQSFSAPEDLYLTSVGLFFKSKDPTHSIVVQVRNMDNGLPGSLILAESIVHSSDVKTSTNASAETRVKLNQPVYCRQDEQYAICILTDSTKYTMHYAKLGERQYGSGTVVTGNPYLEGVMFSSSNSLTWTPHQDSDLKFTAYSAQFQYGGSIEFNPIELDPGITRIIPEVDLLDYNNAGATLYYKFKQEDPWVSVFSGYEIDVSSSAGEGRSLFIKIELGLRGNLSPLLAKDAFNLIANADHSEATYVSRTVFLSEAYTTLKVTAEMHMPSGCSYELYYNKTGKPDNWTKITSPPSITHLSLDQGDERSRYEWNEDGLEATSYKVKLVVKTSSLERKPRVYQLMNIMRY